MGYKFEIGDTVIVTANNHGECFANENSVGKIGEVAYRDDVDSFNRYVITFNNQNEFDGLWDCDGIIPNNNGRYIAEDELEIYVPAVEDFSDEWDRLMKGETS